MKTFVARGIRYGTRAGRTPSMWPVYLFMPWTRRAFDRSFERTFVHRSCGGYL